MTLVALSAKGLVVNLNNQSSQLKKYCHRDQIETSSKNVFIAIKNNNTQLCTCFTFRGSNSESLTVSLFL